jgi:hypothetical protein
MSMSAKAGDDPKLQNVDEVANMENSPIQSNDLDNSREELVPLATDRTQKQS